MEKWRGEHITGDSLERDKALAVTLTRILKRIETAKPSWDRAEDQITTVEWRLGIARENQPEISESIVCGFRPRKEGHPVNGEVERGSALSGSQIWFPVRLSI